MSKALVIAAVFFLSFSATGFVTMFARGYRSRAHFYVNGGAGLVGLVLLTLSVVVQS